VAGVAGASLGAIQVAAFLVGAVMGLVCYWYYIAWLLRTRLARFRLQLV
jgi:hypothetical protein